MGWIYGSSLLLLVSRIQIYSNSEDSFEPWPFSLWKVNSYGREILSGGALRCGEEIPQILCELDLDPIGLGLQTGNVHRCIIV